jgi:hypothetical protein
MQFNFEFCTNPLLISFFVCCCNEEVNILIFMLFRYQKRNSRQLKVQVLTVLSAKGGEFTSSVNFNYMIPSHRCPGPGCY